MADKTLPTTARVVIIGGGIMGCSLAYHLTKLGWRDVIILEQGALSGGTTWHAAGLVGQLRGHENLTRLIQYSTELYAKLEAETGQATGWKTCGSLTVARTADRMTALQRTAAKARAYGVEAQVITADDALQHWPVMETKDLAGAVWLPGDGKANPTDITQALAKGARQNGARIFEKTRVTAIGTVKGANRREVTGVSTNKGDIACEIVVNCAGQWARQVGRLCGVTVPLYSCEHMYIVTEPLEGVQPDLPCLRDPDGYIYFKEEVGGLIMGGFEPNAKPWARNPIPDDFEFTLLDDDWDQFEILMENALLRVPALANTGVKQFINGPECFTPDGYFILGEAPELRNFFVGAGFNSMGIASAGGAGLALAEWIIEGSATSDVWPVDIRRFASFQGNDSWLKSCVKETLGLHYVMPWPNREVEAGRPLRCSPVYDQLKKRGACFGSRMGWERPLFYAPSPELAKIDYGFGRQNWFPWSAAEHKAARGAVALFDLSSFAKLLVQGRDAENLLQRLCANDVAVAPGRAVYTAMLNERGGFESDVTVTRLDDTSYFVVTGSAQAVRDRDWITRNIGDAKATVTDLTSSYAVFAIMGPNARTLLAKVSDRDLSNDAFPFASAQEIGIGPAQVRALRMTYVGELGWELYVPTEFAAGVYQALIDAGADSGLVHAGYYALDSLRLEKAYRSWGHELTTDETPLDAGLAFALALDKPVPFIGRDALRAQADRGITKRLVQFVLEDPEPVLWGGELILRDGKPVGDLKSGGYGHSLGAAVGLGYVAARQGASKAFIESGSYEIDIAGALVPAKAFLRPAFDPKSTRVHA